MNEREIGTIRDKIGTDPILTDEEIDYIWMVMDKQEPMKPDIYPSGRFYIFECSECGITVSGVNKYCHNCGQKFKWGV